MLEPSIMIATQASPKLNPARRTFVAAVALGLALFGCKAKGDPNASGTPGPATSAAVPHFAFVTNNSSDFWNIATKGVHKAEADFGIKAEVFRPLKGEVSDQQRFLEDILVQNFDGVAISPIDAAAMSPLLDKVSARMPVVCMDSDAPNSKRIAYVGSDNVAAGHVAGKAAVDALAAAGTKTGKVALFVGRMDMQNSIERKQGIDEVLSKVGGLEVLPVFLDGADRAKAKKNVEDALARYPDLVLMIGIWSYNGPALAGATRASSRAKKPAIVVFDEEEETLKAIDDGLIFATIAQKPFEFGVQAMKLLKDAKDGKPVAKSVDTGLTTVTKATLAPFWEQLKALKK
jgi:ribose transport system substrate-binding protein